MPRSAPVTLTIARQNLERADREFTETLDGTMQRAARLAGSNLACRPGCSECCVGPFPINRLDAWRLREGLAALHETAPERAAAIVERARQAVDRFRADFPGDAASGRLSGDQLAEDRFFEAHASEPCPALDQASGTCELYAHRPGFCRTYGPPVRLGGQSLPPCRLCFVNAPESAIEASRVEPDREHLEQAILARLKRDEGDQGETIIAAALAADPGEER